MTDYAAQTSISDEPRAAFVGMLADMGPTKTKSGVATTRKLVSVAVTADNDDVYTITINGTPFVYTADGSATVAEVVLGLKALINAGDEPVLASGTTSPLLIESTIDGAAGDFTYSDGVVGVATLTETVLVTQGEVLGFGKFVCADERSTNDRAVRLPRLSADVTSQLGLGVVICENYTRIVDSTLSAPANSMVPVLEQGRIWVAVEEAVAKGDDAYVRYAAGGSGLGSFRKSTGTSEAAALPRACFDSASRTISGVLMAILKLNR
jgi:hypothetical protein